MNRDDDDFSPTDPTKGPVRRARPRYVDENDTMRERADPSPDVPFDDEDDLGRTRRPPRGVRLEDDDEETTALPVGWLVIVAGSGLGHAAVLETGVNIIGRGEDNHITLPFGDREIATTDHARVSYNRAKRQFRVVPGRGHETFVGDDLIDEPTTIKAGDIVRIGRTELRFAPFCDEKFDWTEALGSDGN